MRYRRYHSRSYKVNVVVNDEKVKSSPQSLRSGLFTWRFTVDVYMNVNAVDEQLKEQKGETEEGL